MTKPANKQLSTTIIDGSGVLEERPAQQSSQNPPTPTQRQANSAYTHSHHKDADGFCSDQACSVLATADDWANNIMWMADKQARKARTA